MLIRVKNNFKTCYNALIYNLKHMAIKSFLKPTTLFPFIVSFIILAIIFSPVFAAPNANPPLGTINATFNSLNVAGVANFSGGLSIDANGVIKSSMNTLRINSWNGLTVADNAGVVSFSVTGSTGGLSNPKAGEPLKISDPDGFALQPTYGSARLLINAQGEISNPQTGNTNKVRIYDSEGFVVGSGSPSVEWFSVSGTGQISSPPTNSPVTINDPDGLLITQESTTFGLQINADGSLTQIGTGQASGRVSISDGDGIQLLDNGSVPRFRVEGSTGNIATTGWITAEDGIGAYGLRSHGLTVNPGATLAPNVVCTSSERPISCSYSTTAPFGTFDVRSMHPSGNGCSFSIRNNSASSQTFIQHVLCFDPSIHFHNLD